MPADTNKPKRYVVTYDGGFIAWQYREAKDSDKGERIWYRECDYAALAAENERLKASVRHYVEQDALRKAGEAIHQQRIESGSYNREKNETIKRLAAEVEHLKTRPTLANQYADYAALAAENERLRKASEWHSKDTLPKEDVDVLCMSGNFMFVGWVDRHGIWQSSDDSRFVPDCWMPLPQAPAKEGDAK